MSRGVRWSRPDRRTVLRLILLTLAAVVAGIAQFASYQPTGLWWAAPLGLGILFAAVDHIVGSFVIIINSFHSYSMIIMALKNSLIK